MDCFCILIRIAEQTSGHDVQSVGTESRLFATSRDAKSLVDSAGRIAGTRRE
jgi:hypothetical protein